MAIEIRDTLEALLAEDQIPRDIYEFEIIGDPFHELPPKDATPEEIAEFSPSWCKVNVRIVEARDPANNVPQVLGRTIPWWPIGQKTGRRELAYFLKHKAIYDPEGGWEKGLPEDENGKKTTSALAGVKFIAALRSWRGKDNEWKYEFKPLMEPPPPNRDDDA